MSSYYYNPSDPAQVVEVIRTLPDMDGEPGVVVRYVGGPEGSEAWWPRARLGRARLAASMDFGQALRLMREGFAVRRTTWEDGRRRMVLRRLSPDEPPRFCLLHDLPSDPIVRPMIPQQDLLALDWELTEAGEE